MSCRPAARTTESHEARVVDPSGTCDPSGRQRIVRRFGQTVQMPAGAKHGALALAAWSIAVLAPITVGGVGASSTPVRGAEGWNAETGWLPLPAVPPAAPSEAWRIELVGEARYEVRPAFV